jgi:hypothetical protein
MRLSAISQRRLAAIAATACAVALIPACALAVTTSPAVPSAASTPACATSGLVVWMNTTGSAYAGGIYYTLEFTNLSGHTCTLHGYPGVSAVTLSGRPVGSPGLRSPARPTTVSLPGGATATATLQITDPGNFGTVCFLPGPPPEPGRPGKLPTAAGLRVYPPNQFTSKVIPFPFSACYRTGPVWLHVTPVQK